MCTYVYENANLKNQNASVWGCKSTSLTRQSSYSQSFWCNLQYGQTDKCDSRSQAGLGELHSGVSWSLHLVSSVPWAEAEVKKA